MRLSYFVFLVQVKDFNRGDILFSLTYLPNAERLTLVLLKARNLRLAEWGDHYVGKSGKLLLTIFIPFHMLLYIYVTGNADTMS